MEVTPSGSKRRGRILLFIPKWLSNQDLPQGLPVQGIPVVDALARNGWAVDLWCEEQDGLNPDDARRRIDAADVAALWSNAFDPGTQIGALRTFFGAVRARRPETRRLAGGGFLVTQPASFDLGGDIERVTETGPWALAAQLGPVTDRRPTMGSLEQLDLRAFFAPSALRFGNDEPTLALPTGTGCGRSCPFCVHENSPQHLVPADAVAETMVRTFHRHGVRQFSLAEQDFLADRQRALDLATRLSSRGLPLSWTVNASIPDVLRLTEEDLSILAGAGLAGVEMGVEAGSDSALAKLGKDYRVVHAVRAHDRLLAHGIDPVHDLLFGWPGETTRDRRATLDLVERLNRTGRRGAFRFRRYRAVPTTSTGDAALRFGGPQPLSLEGLETLDASGRTMPWLSPQEERRVRLLTDYILPMAYRPRPTADDARSWKTLSTLARIRCRTGLMALPVDRAIFAASGEAAPATH